MSYHGWKNYQTWAMFTAITSYEDVYKLFREVKYFPLDKKAELMKKTVDEMFYDIIDIIKEHIEDNEYAEFIIGIIETAYDLFINEVDFYEIAKSDDFRISPELGEPTKNPKKLKTM